MILNRITLYNFRQFEGKQTIEFSKDPKKNVTIVKGENGAGKTTLLQAFMWCLYEKLDLPNEESLLTTEIFNDMRINEKEDVWVEIIFTHKTREYILKRCYSLEKTKNKELKRVDKKVLFQYKVRGKLKDIAPTELENIIPQDLATYFFFDGERIENLSKSNSKGRRDLSLAVRNMLGLDSISNGIKHTQKVLDNLDNDYNGNADDNIINKRSELIEKKEKLKVKENEKKDIEQEIEAINDRLDLVLENLKSFDDLKGYENQRLILEKSIKNIDTSIQENKNDIRRINKDGFPNFIADKIVKIFKDKIQIKDMTDKGINGIDGTAIDCLINRGYCICGKEIKAGTKEFDCLIAQKEYQPPASLGVILNQFKERTEKNLKESKQFKERTDDKFKILETNIIKLEDANNELEDLSKKLLKLDYAKELEKKRLELIQDKNDKVIGLELKKQDINNLKNEIENIETDIDKLSLHDEKNKIITIRKEYVKEVIKELQIFYDAREIKVRNSLNEKVNDIFKKLISSKHVIQMEEDYTFSVIDIDGEVSTSQGQDILTSFAFISGIISLAKEKHDDIDINEQYPLIMDAPFAKLSKVHRKNVAMNLPNIAEQFILFTVDSQFEGDIEDNLVDRIGKEYELIPITEGKKYTKIEER
ncbi:AAA family ATPase [Clostridium chromiireducens]|uniref:Nuclease SbcCD subunit C n=1 Tax=Clostridium chromiireducens TaxID=225345 RepID=A0A1V4I911_9CLOT|nr:AAA family ATPase [Clostridium chromiireducens]OPJ56115.1 chromosome segregation protein [Clostridium chromiireducens]